MVSTTPITFHPLGAVISGAELRQLRTTDLRLSQRQLGLALGVTPATISNWELAASVPVAGALLVQLMVGLWKPHELRGLLLRRAVGE